MFPLRSPKQSMFLPILSQRPCWSAKLILLLTQMFCFYLFHQPKDSYREKAVPYASIRTTLKSNQHVFIKLLIFVQHHTKNWRYKYKPKRRHTKSLQSNGRGRRWYIKGSWKSRARGKVGMWEYGSEVQKDKSGACQSKARTPFYKTLAPIFHSDLAWMWLLLRRIMRNKPRNCLSSWKIKRNDGWLVWATLGPSSKWTFQEEFTKRKSGLQGRRIGITRWENQRDWENFLDENVAEVQRPSAGSQKQSQDMKDV